MLQSKTLLFATTKREPHNYSIKKRSNIRKKIQVINGQDPLNQSKALVCTKSQVNTQQSKYE